MDKKEQFDYTQMQELEYKGKKYLFNPYSMGVGMWAEKTAAGKAGRYASKEIQKKLNKEAFGYEELPNMAERINKSSGEKKQRIRQTAIEWLQAKFMLIKGGFSQVPESTSENISGFHGMMFFYRYDPKYKDILPIWDEFPLVIILKQYDNGFLGLNLHYASEDDRNSLLASLLSSRIYDPELNRIKVNIDYQRLVQNVEKYPGFKKCIKRYLTSHIKGRVLEIKPHEWGLAVILPGAEFHTNEKKSKR